MKKIIQFLLIILFSVQLIRCESQSSPDDDSNNYTPVIFIHGTGGWHFSYTSLAGLSGQGYPDSYINAVWLPAISTKGKYCIDEAGTDCPADDASYSSARWAQVGNYTLNTAALKTKVDAVLTATGSSKIDLIGHSNGSEVIRMFLGQNTTYINKVRKVIAVSGAKVNNAIPSICPDTSTFKYVNEITPNWPSGPEYHAISSDSDAVFDWITQIYCTGGGTRYFASSVGSNHKLTGMDHIMISAHEDTFETIYKILTGKDAGVPKTNSTVTIAGFVKERNTNYTRQTGTGNVNIKIEYFNPTTGETEAGIVGTDTTSNDGLWGPITVSTSKNLKITYTLGLLTKVYYIADKITQNFHFLEVEKPKSDLTTTYPYLSDGNYRLLLWHNGQYFNRDVYENIPVTSITGNMEVNSPSTTVNFTAEMVPQYPDSTNWSTSYGPLDKQLILSIHNVFEWADNNHVTYGVNNGGYIYKMSDTSEKTETYATFTINMDGNITKVNMNSNDLENNYDINLYFLKTTNK